MSANEKRICVNKFQGRNNFWKAPR